MSNSLLSNPFVDQSEAEVGIAWAAGLFEGEGSVCAVRAGKSGHTLRVQIGMTDKDVLERFASIVGFGRVRGPYNSSGKRTQESEEKHKKVYVWSIGRREQQIAVINMLWPYLCSRRRKQVIEAHAKIKPIRHPGKGVHDGDRTGRWLQAV